jgi:hypothetical protein
MQVSAGAMKRWERGPFGVCPECQRNTFGILSAGGDRLTLRCTECRYSHSEVLPEVEKRVIYLDQSIFSLLFQMREDGRLPAGHEEFARDLYRRIRHVVLLQQAIAPHSDVHHDETTVFHSANKLRLAYEWIGGDARLKDTREVEQMQMWEYAQAYIEQREPALSLDVDEVLENTRNEWLPDMHIHVNVNYDMFADGIREDRARSHDGMQQLIKKWAAERPTFEQLLDQELRAFFGRPQHLLAQSRMSSGPLRVMIRWHFLQPAITPCWKSMKCFLPPLFAPACPRRMWGARCCASGIGIATWSNPITEYRLTFSPPLGVGL